MEFSTRRGSGREERLQQLNIRRDNDGRIPIFGGQFGVLGIAGGLEVAVVLQNGIVAKNLPVLFGGLLDDAGIGNRNDDAPLVVSQGMF